MNNSFLRKGIIFAVILVSILSFSLISFAALPENNEISPLWINMYGIDLDFYFSNDSGIASGDVIQKTSATLIEATLTVYRKEGFRWVTVASNTASSTISLAIDTEFNAIKGATYKAVIDVIAYGTSVDETESISKIETYQ